MTKNANVVELNPRSALASGEFNDIIKTLSVVNWSLQVQTIVGALGIPISENLENADTQLPMGSVAESLGHKTVGSFITSPKENLGLSKDWSEWASQSRAFRLKSTYNIYSETPREIIAQFDDVAQVLGRSPSTATEYHFTKDTILARKRQESERNHKMQINDQGERIADLMKRLEAEASELTQERQNTAALEAKLTATIRDMEIKLNEAKRNHDTELERRLTLQLRELETNFAQRLEETKTQADMRVKETQERLAEIQAHYRDNYVSKDDHSVVLEQLQRERETNFKLIGNLNEANKRLEDALAQSELDKRALELEKSQVIELTNQVEKLSSRIDAIVMAPFASENNEVVLELQKQVDDLNTQLEARNSADELIELSKTKLLGRIQNLKTMLIATRDALEASEAKNQTLTIKVKKLRSSIRSKAAQIAASKSNFRALAAILGVSAITTVVLIISAL